MRRRRGRRGVERSRPTDRAAGRRSYFPVEFPGVGAGVACGLLAGAGGGPAGAGGLVSTSGGRGRCAGTPFSSEFGRVRGSLFIGVYLTFPGLGSRTGRVKSILRRRTRRWTNS